MKLKTAKKFSPKQRILEDCVPEPNSGCWIWIGHSMPYGHGRLKYDGKLILAHRLAYEAFIGPIKQGMCVCHKCDTPACVNPDHLFLGNRADNNRDKVRKGRQPLHHGICNPNAALTETDVLEIIQSDEWPRYMAKKFGISRNTVHDIRSGRTWKHLQQEQS